MALRIDAERVKRFEAMFQSPSLVAMLDLLPDEFEQFVKYVFECAGYGVKYVGNIPFPEGPGVHLDLHGGSESGKVLARVEVRRYTPPNTVTLQQVAAFIGLTQLKGDMPGYMVTTSDFTPAAYAAARDTNGRVRLLNGDHLLRYITYVGGSRVTGPDGASLAECRAYRAHLPLGSR